jgi:hypothetical protein
MAPKKRERDKMPSSSSSLHSSADVHPSSLLRPTKSTILISSGPSLTVIAPPPSSGWANDDDDDDKHTMSTSERISVDKASDNSLQALKAARSAGVGAVVMLAREAQQQPPRTQNVMRHTSTIAAAAAAAAELSDASDDDCPTPPWNTQRPSLSRMEIELRFSDDEDDECD